MTKKYSKEEKKEIKAIEAILDEVNKKFPTYKEKKDFWNFLKEKENSDKDNSELNTFIFLLERYLEMINESKRKVK